MCEQGEPEDASKIQEEFIFQQQELIGVLKQEIILLQDEIHGRIRT
jgi:hypothetical protein